MNAKEKKVEGARGGKEKVLRKSHPN